VHLENRGIEELVEFEHFPNVAVLYLNHNKVGSSILLTFGDPKAHRSGDELQGEASLPPTQQVEDA